jgi:hypothetical protein
MGDRAWRIAPQYDHSVLPQLNNTPKAFHGACGAPLCGIFDRQGREGGKQKGIPSQINSKFDDLSHKLHHLRVQR